MNVDNLMNALIKEVKHLQRTKQVNPGYSPRIGRKEALKRVRFKHVIPRDKAGNPLKHRITFAGVLSPAYGEYRGQVLTVAPAFFTESLGRIPTRKEARFHALQKLSLTLQEPLACEVHLRDQSVYQTLTKEERLASLLDYTSPLYVPATRPSGVVFLLKEEVSFLPHNLFLQCCFLAMVCLRDAPFQKAHRPPSWISSGGVLHEFLIDYQFHTARQAQPPTPLETPINREEPAAPVQDVPAQKFVTEAVHQIRLRIGTNE